MEWMVSQIKLCVIVFLIIVMYRVLKNTFVRSMMLVSVSAEC